MAELPANLPAGPVEVFIITAAYVLVAVGVLVSVNWGNPGLTGESAAAELHPLMLVLKVVFSFPRDLEIYRNIHTY